MESLAKMSRRSVHGRNPGGDRLPHQDVPARLNGAPPLLHLRERSLSTTRRSFVRMRMVRSFREYVGSRPAPERNQVRITSHEARIAAILHDLNDVAGEQCAFAVCTGLPMQHRAALEMSAAIDQCQTIPQRKRCSFPKSDARTLAHHPLAIGSVQKYLRIESPRPIHHRRVIMRMRDHDGADTAARVELGQRSGRREA